jgi:hypothetical protein
MHRIFTVIVWIQQILFWYHLYKYLNFQLIIFLTPWQSTQELICNAILKQPHIYINLYWLNSLLTFLVIFHVTWMTLLMFMCAQCQIVIATDAQIDVSVQIQAILLCLYWNFIKKECNSIKWRAYDRIRLAFHVFNPYDMQLYFINREQLNTSDQLNNHID